MKKIKMFLLTAVLLVILTGCSTKELEDRGFPLALGIDKTDTGMVVSFDFPDLTEVSDGKNPSKKPVSFSVEAGAYYEAQKAYENNTNRILDYNHLKSIIIGQEFLSDQEAMRDLFSWFEGEEVLARNTCLFLAKESAASILTLSEGTSGSVGKYLEQMAESQEDFKDNKIMTIGKLMNQWHNQNELLLIPVLTENGGIPGITEYGVVDAFAYCGNITVEDAMKAFLSQGLLKSFTYRMGDGEVLEIQNISVQETIKTEDNKTVAVVAIKGNGQIKTESKNGNTAAGQVKKRVEQKLKDSMTEAAARILTSPGVDISNSFRMLGGYNREAYHIYRDDYQGYKKSLLLNFTVDITMINE